MADQKQNITKAAPPSNLPLASDDVGLPVRPSMPTRTPLKSASTVMPANDKGKAMDDVKRPVPVSKPSTRRQAPVNATDEDIVESKVIPNPTPTTNAMPTVDKSVAMDDVKKPALASVRPATTPTATQPPANLKPASQVSPPTTPPAPVQPVSRAVPQIFPQTPSTPAPKVVPIPAVSQVKATPPQNLPTATAPSVTPQTTVPQKAPASSAPAVNIGTLQINSPDQPLEFSGKSVESLARRGLMIKIFGIIVGIVVLIGLIVGGYFAYKQWFSGPANPPDKIDNNTSTTNTTNEPKPVTDDKDNDGIKDSWEEKYGLNSSDARDANKDNDFDGLTNLEEFKLGTNPTDNDSDNDGYSDGQEVKDGYNPLGEGKLVDNGDDDPTPIDKSLTTLVKGSWSGSMVGKYFDFTSVTMNLGEDGKAIVQINSRFNNEDIRNEGIGDFTIDKETGVFKTQINEMQGIAKSGTGTFLLSFTGNAQKNYAEITGTWFMVPSSLTAPWMTEDKGTFIIRKQ